MADNILIVIIISVEAEGRCDGSDVYERLVGLSLQFKE
jgi:hypothetical protein